MRKRVFIFKMMTREYFTKKLRFEPRLEGGEGSESLSVQENILNVIDGIHIFV